MLDSKTSFYAITGNVCTHCIVYWKYNTQSRFNACRQVCVSAMEMRQWRPSGRALMILVVNTGVSGRWLSYGCRKLPIDQHANCCTIVRRVCNFTNHESQGRSVLQYNAKQDLILISKKKFWYACNLCVFCDKGMAIPHIKFGFFLAFKQLVWPFSGLFLALFGFLLKFSSGNPACRQCRFQSLKSWVRLFLPFIF